jgi:hypothetical protein
VKVRNVFEKKGTQTGSNGRILGLLMVMNRLGKGMRMFGIRTKNA